MSNTPIISCVIPVFNGKRELRRAVDSALAQLPGVQVVLVDDGSTDGSAELVAAMAAADPRIVALTLPTNRGQGFARNVGVAAAEADYITFLDQDDEHLPGWYALALDVLESNPGVAGVKGDMELIDIPAGANLTRGDPRWQEMVYSVIWNMILRKVAYGVVGGSPTSAEYRTREGKEDIALVTALVRNFRAMPSSYVATRHYIQPDGATSYYLRRTTVVDNRVQYNEITDAERNALRSGSADDFQARVVANVASVRAMLQPPTKGVRVALAKASGRILRKLTS
jgi:glycosyltransferase involved in cell wall biosynthesis